MNGAKNRDPQFVMRGGTKNVRYIYILMQQLVLPMYARSIMPSIPSKLKESRISFVKLGCNSIAHETVSESTQRFLEHTTNP